MCANVFWVFWGYIYEEILTWGFLCAFFGRRTKKVLDLIPCTLIVPHVASIIMPKGHICPISYLRSPLWCIALVGTNIDPLFGASNYLEIGGYIPLEIYNCCVNIHKEILTPPSMCATMGAGRSLVPRSHKIPTRKAILRMAKSIRNANKLSYLMQRVKRRAVSIRRNKLRCSLDAHGSLNY